MIRVACAILFLVGCFGQQSINITLPTDPAVPTRQNVVTNIPSAPSGVSGPELLSSLPVLPQVLRIRRTRRVERPCRARDIQCIRRYFRRNSRCRRALGRAPDPLVIPVANLFYPRFNITQIDVNPNIMGMNNARIREFHINRPTDKLVLGIQFRNIAKNSSHSFFRYHRRGREPIITHGFTSISTSSLYITVTIPQLNNLRLDRSHTHGYSNGSTLAYSLQPTLGQSSDPLVPTTFAALRANIPTAAREYWLTSSPFLGASFIQYLICDFGLQLLL